MLTGVKTRWTERTFKREVAAILLGFWAVITLLLTIRVVVFPGDPALIAAVGAAYGPIHSSITTWVMTFAGVAFSLDAASKQLGMGEVSKPDPDPKQ